MEKKILVLIAYDVLITVEREGGRGYDAVVATEGMRMEDTCRGLYRGEWRERHRGRERGR